MKGEAYDYGSFLIGGIEACSHGGERLEEEKKKYMNDLYITFHHPNWKIVEIKHQNSIHFAQKLGQKSSYTLPNCQSYLSNITVQKSDTVKHLGLVFDSKLD